MNDEQGPFCKDEQRRADLLDNPDLSPLNGIHYVEVDAADHKTLHVYFLKPVLAADSAEPEADAYGISADMKNITITGGTRVVGIKAISAERESDGHLRITVDQAGDYSIYALTINVPSLDPRLRRALLSFMASCPVDFDCRREVECPPPELSEPALDYLAKDYASFRRLMLDLLPQLNPRFIERNPSDLGIALIELLAYHGDRLSYLQDAVANEAYLDTVRQHISARRHARLIDYRMHDGRNAWVYVHVTVNATSPLDLPLGTKVLTRIVAPLAGDASPPGVVVDEHRITADALERDPALASTVVFETTHPAEFDHRNNEIFIHAWGDEQCCLRPGTTEIFLYSVPDGPNTAVLPVLKKGDYLLLEEVKDPLSGVPADADPSHRQVVLIEEAKATKDPLYSNQLVNDAPQWWQHGQQELPLLRVRWRREDALRFPLCLSSRPPGKELLRNVSVARGNIVLTDHGLSTEDDPQSPAVPAGRPFRLRLAKGPLTMQCQPDPIGYDGTTGRCKTARRALDCDIREAKPSVTVWATFPTDTDLWTPVPDLLDSTPFDRHFVAEVDNDGHAILRFGDEEYGCAVTGATKLQALYRIGNGRAGNVGAEALAHIAPSSTTNWVVAVRNPLPAQGGVDPETIEEVRQWAPEAFRAEPLRAVTEADYAAAACKLPEVAGAVASFRWTGSWYTVFVGVDPLDSTDLVNEPGGHTRLSPGLKERVRSFLTRYRLAGYHLEIRPPTFVSLEIDLEVCAATGHFRADVARAVADALSNRDLPDGRRGFFHHDNFTFGQPVYASQIYAAVERVEGVDSAVITKLRRFGQPDNGELASGVVPIGPWEIARLENDPNFMEHGVLRITAMGGKG